MFERFRDSYGEHRWLSDAPGYLFATAERKDAISFAAFAILFLWDCHVLTDTADTCLSPTMRSAGFVRVRRCLCLCWRRSYRHRVIPAAI